MSDETDAVMANYTHDDGYQYVLIIEYNNPEYAVSAHSTLMESWLHDADEDDVSEIEDGFWSGARLNGYKLYVVFADSHSFTVLFRSRTTETKFFSDNRDNV